MAEKRAVPRKVKILGRKWKVSLISPETGITGGTCLCTKQEVDISNHLCAEQQRVALYHEIFEGINGDLDLGLTHYQITILAEIWNQVLNDNPEIWQMDTEKA